MKAIVQKKVDRVTCDGCSFEDEPEWCRVMHTDVYFDCSLNNCIYVIEEVKGMSDERK